MSDYENEKAFYGEKMGMSMKRKISGVIKTILLFLLAIKRL